MGTFGVHNLTMQQFRSSKISHTLKNGSKWVLSGHTISPCSSVLKNGSKWVLSGHTISPCGAAPSYLHTGAEVNQNAKFLSYSKMGMPKRERGGERERELYPHLSHLDQAKFLTYSKMGLNGSLYEPTT